MEAERRAAIMVQAARRGAVERKNPSSKSNQLKREKCERERERKLKEEQEGSAASKIQAARRGAVERKNPASRSNQLKREKCERERKLQEEQDVIKIQDSRLRNAELWSAIRPSRSVCTWSLAGRGRHS